MTDPRPAFPMRGWAWTLWLLTAACAGRSPTELPSQVALSPTPASPGGDAVLSGTPTDAGAEAPATTHSLGSDTQQCGLGRLSGIVATLDGYPREDIHPATLAKSDGSWLTHWAYPETCDRGACLVVNVYLSRDEGCTWKRVLVGSGTARAETLPGTQPDVVFQELSGGWARHRWDRSTGTYRLHAVDMAE